ncbi:type II toxin-antitoxin system RelE/ParE family toxin [Lentisalinibacter sediminis]|uniref:type II toxin-antitoxin system RelE/ParE family toxin n=1 Tax=Lentisalinibacter sediminis TaxID=2992237 RepID=UPI0038655190
MAEYRLSWRATKDLREIAEFSVRQFGAAQARSYGRGLISAMEMLTRHPLLGSDLGHVRPRIRRYVYGSHTGPTRSTIASTTMALSF